MARPQLAIDARVGGERQEARGGGNAVALDDDRAVVQRREALKDADQQVVGQPGFEQDAALDVNCASRWSARSR
jgi:hypothetical protein